MVHLFKNLEFAFDILNLAFDYRFSLKSRLNFTLLGTNREILGKQSIPLNLPIMIIDSRCIINNLQERIRLFR